MTKYIKRKDGTFAGSIGEGHSNTPQTAGRRPAPLVHHAPAETHANIDSAFDRFSEAGTPPLPYGPLDDTRARFALTMGECHNLAVAVHRLTGWPLIGFSPWNEDEPGSTGVLTHVGVLSPDGYVLDGHGVTKLEWAEQQGEYDGEEIANERELLEWVSADTGKGSSEWLEFRPEAFTGYVEPLLAKYRATVAKVGL